MTRRRALQVLLYATWSKTSQDVQGPGEIDAHASKGCHSPAPALGCRGAAGRQAQAHAW
jgi:hypothetical protein